jgi:hypothetical protein
MSQTQVEPDRESTAGTPRTPPFSVTKYSVQQP